MSKNMKKIFLIVLAFAALSIPAMAQEVGAKTSSSVVSRKFDKVPQEIKSKVSEFFKFTIKGEVTLAFNRFLEKSPLMDKQEEMSNLIKQTNRSFDIYGQMKGYEEVEVENVTESFMRLRYISLHTKYPLRWIFTFYNSPDFGWIAVNVKFDDLSEFFFKQD